MKRLSILLPAAALALCANDLELRTQLSGNAVVWLVTALRLKLQVWTYQHAKAL